MAIKTKWSNTKTEANKAVKELKDQGVQAEIIKCGDFNLVRIVEKETEVTDEKGN